jgi:hypothetical protein
MVGPWGLEPQTSTVSIYRSQVLQRLTRRRGLPKYAEVHVRHTSCGLGCGLENNIHALSNIGERSLIPTIVQPETAVICRSRRHPTRIAITKPITVGRRVWSAGVWAHCYRKRPVSVKRARISDRSRLRIVEAAKVKRTANGELFVAATIILRTIDTSAFFTSDGVFGKSRVEVTVVC